jgi:hypothetical protein
MPSFPCPNCRRTLTLTDEQFATASASQCPECGAQFSLRPPVQQPPGPPDPPARWSEPDRTPEQPIVQTRAPTWFYVWACVFFATASLCMILGMLFYIEMRVRVAAAEAEAERHLEKMKEDAEQAAEKAKADMEKAMDRTRRRLGDR